MEARDSDPDDEAAPVTNSRPQIVTLFWPDCDWILVIWLPLQDWLVAHNTIFGVNIHAARAAGGRSIEVDTQVVQRTALVLHSTAVGAIADHAVAHVNSCIRVCFRGGRRQVHAVRVLHKKIHQIS